MPRPWRNKGSRPVHRCDAKFRWRARAVERDVEQWADYHIKNHDFSRESVVTHMRDEYSTFGWVIERMLTDTGFTLVSVDYHAPLHGTYLLRKPKHGEQG